ncbi:ABC transporter permease, partial [Methylobacterium radiotolerans]
MILAVVLVLVLGYLAISIGGNPNLQWNIMWQYVGNQQVLSGLWVTIELTVICMVSGAVLGVLLAIMALSHNRVP